MSSRECESYPGWLEIDCGCCGGIMWGGDYPRECDQCNGGGYLFLHQKSGVLAQWPGGPFLGKMSKNNGDMAESG